MENIKLKDNYPISIVANNDAIPSFAISEAISLSGKLGCKVFLELNGFIVSIPSIKSVPEIVKDYNKYLQLKEETDYWHQFERKDSYTEMVSKHLYEKKGEGAAKYKQSSEFYQDALKRTEIEKSIIRSMEKKENNPVKLKQTLNRDDKHKLNAIQRKTELIAI